MSSQSTTGAKTSLDPVIGQIFSAIAALIAGWKALEPRFARLRMFQREGGQYSLALRVLYWFPQALNVVLMLALIIALIAALFGGLDVAGLLPLSMQGPDSTITFLARSIYGYGWVLVIAALLVGVLIYLDVFAMVMIVAAWTLSFLPIPWFRGRFGPNGDSLGWHQARELLRNQGQAQLVWIDSKGVERVAAAVFEKLASEPVDGKDRAPTPENASLGERANIALLGCIIEQIETDIQKPRRRWDIFYAAFAEVAAAQGLFKPETLRDHDPAISFAERVRTSVNAVLAGANEPTIGFDVDGDINKAAELLRVHFKGDALGLASGWRKYFFGPVQALFYRARRFPRLSDDTMCPQFVKLCIRWNVIPNAEPRIFVQPFSAGLAWLLLHLGALRALSDQKIVNFNGPIDRPASRIVAAAVISEVLVRVNASMSGDTGDLRNRFSGSAEPKRSWLIRQEADTTMWRLARELAANGAASQWKGEGWQWKFDNRTATRI